MSQVFWKKFYQFPIKWNLHLPHNSVILRLEIFLKEVRAHVHENIICECLYQYYLYTPQLETTQMSITKRMDMQIAVYP